MNVTLTSNNYFYSYGTFDSERIVSESKDFIKQYSSIQEQMKDVRNHFSKYDASLIEVEFINSLLKKEGFEIEKHEDFCTDGHDTSGRKFEFKRIKRDQMDKTLFVQKRFFHYKEKCIWIEYSDNFDLIRIYDLYDVDLKHGSDGRNDFYYTTDDINPVYEFLIIEGSIFDIKLERFLHITIEDK